MSKFVQNCANFMKDNWRYGNAIGYSTIEFTERRNNVGLEILKTYLV